MFKSPHRLTLLFILLVLFDFTLLAQQKEDQTKTRPKIGLVLSGGGAKGLAHIGVLKVLEELGIRPDYITGTSMGSIVGGLYSIGYTAKELDSLNKAIDWGSIFSDKLSYNQIDINVKKNYTSFQLNLSGNSFNEIKLPVGLVQGQLISEMLEELTWRSIDIESFDDFPIPFRCVAADIISGKPIVFKSGNLAKAIRASMSIPTAFTPIVQDTMLLVDGGVINNFPVQECINMGADIIIGVYVGSNENVKASDLNTLVKIMNHSASFLGVVNAKNQMENLDIKIIPDLKGASVESFNRAEEIVQLGEDAARSKDVYTKLKTLSDSLKLFPEKPMRIIAYTDNALSVQKISINGLNRVKKEFVIGMSQLKENSLVNTSMLNEALKRLHRTLLFDKIEYRFIKKGYYYDLVFEVIEKDLISLNASVYYDNFYGAGLFINASYNNWLINSSRLDLTLDLSQYPRINLSYNIIGGEKKRSLFSLGINTQSIVIPNFYEFPNSLIVSMGQFRNNQLTFSTSYGFSISRNSKIEMKASHISNFFQLQGGLEYLYDINRVSSNYFSLEGTFKINSLNHPVFPMSGVLFELTYKRILNPVSSFTTDEGLFKPISDKNDVVVIDYKQYFRIGRRFSIIPELTVGVMSSIPFYADKFFLGGNGFNSRINNFSQAGVQAFHIATDNFVQAGIGLQINLYENWYFNAFNQYVRFINNSETFTEQSLKIDSESISGWGTSIAYSSIFGPLSFSATRNMNNDKFYYYLSLGFTF